MARNRRVNEFNRQRWSTGHISYDTEMINFLGDVHAREEKQITKCWARTRTELTSAAGKYHGVRNVLLAEGEPTPRKMRVLKRRSAQAKVEPHPFGIGSLEMPEEELARLSARSAGRRNASQPLTARSTASNASYAPSIRAAQAILRSDALHTLSSSLPWESRSNDSESQISTFRSVSSNASDISLSDIENLELKRTLLQEKLNRIDERLLRRATNSPKVSRKYGMKSARSGRSTSRSARGSVSSSSSSRRHRHRGGVSTRAVTDRTEHETDSARLFKHLAHKLQEYVQ